MENTETKARAHTPIDLFRIETGEPKPKPNKMSSNNEVVNIAFTRAL
jgi:hypothetical protein